MKRTIITGAISTEIEITPFGEIMVNRSLTHSCFPEGMSRCLCQDKVIAPGCWYTVIPQKVLTIAEILPESRRIAAYVEGMEAEHAAKIRFLEEELTAL